MSHVILAGPTASGKTELALALARESPRVEIINADSRQTLAGLYVGTCAPAPETLSAAPHHLFGYRPPGHPPTAAEWLADADAALAAVAARGNVALVVGGTGLYLRALLFGLDDTGPAPDPVFRRRRTELAATPAGADALRTELRQRDPGAAERIDMANPRRVIRALEIIDATGEGLGRVWRGGAPPRLPGLSLSVAPEELGRRIERRALAMFADGGIQNEVTESLAAGVTESELIASGIGYREALELLAGTIGADEAVRRTAERTRRYAKAQRTFLRSLPTLQPVPADAAARVLGALLAEAADAGRAKGGEP